MNGGQFAYVDDTASQSPPEQEALKAGGNHSQASIVPRVYKNVQLIPRPKDQTLTSQLSAAGAGTGPASRNVVGLRKSQNMRSLRNALFNVSSEQGLSDSPEAYVSPLPGDGTEQI